MVDENQSDYILISAFCNGSELAFEIIYHRYRNQLYGYLNNLIGYGSSDADDVFSETWVRVIKNAHKYRDDGKFLAWVFRIARNLYLDKYRSRKSSQVVASIDDENVSSFIGEAPESAEPDYFLNLADVGDKIGEILELISPEQKETFLLRMEDLSFKEIAEIQGCSLNTVLARMRYAVNNIKKHIHQLGLEELKR